MRKILALAVAVLIALLLFSCAKNNEEAAPMDTSTMRISAILPHNDFSYWTELANGIWEAAQELPVDVKIYTPQMSYNVHQMTELIRQQTAAQVNAIIVQGTEDEDYLKALEAAQEQGIQIVFVDTDVPEFADHLYVGTDNYQAGYETGLHLIEMSGGSAKVAVMSGASEFPNLNLRLKGIQDAVANEEDVQILRVEYNNFDALTAVEIYHAVQKENSNIDTLVCIEGTGAHALGMSPVGERKLKNLIGFDDSVGGLAGVRSGLIDGLIVQENKKMGKLCIEELYRWHETGAYSSDKILTGVAWVTAEDLPEEANYAEDE